MARQLQKAAVRLLSEQTCRRFYPVQISSRMLCAGFPQGGVDSCSVSDCATEPGLPGATPSGRKAPQLLPPSSALPQTEHLSALLEFPLNPALVDTSREPGSTPTTTSPSQVEGSGAAGQRPCLLQAHQAGVHQCASRMKAHLSIEPISQMQ